MLTTGEKIVDKTGRACVKGLQLRIIFGGMAKEKVESKLALLLTPLVIKRTGVMFESLYINKSAKGISFNTKALDRQEINKSWAKVPGIVKDVLTACSLEGMQKEEQRIKQRFVTQRGGVDIESFSQKALKRYMHQQVETLKPFSSIVKWYHKQPSTDGKHVRLQPCVLSSLKPRLSFKLTRGAKAIIVNSYVELNGTLYPLQIFNRYDYLLESNNEYFLLSFKDHQTLDWLLSSAVREYCRDDHSFREHVLVKLEDDYTVDQNDLFEVQEVSVAPTNRVLLSELNDSFLMLTPQWVYEGFVVEGAFKEKEEIRLNGEVYRVNRHRQAEMELMQTLESLHPDFTKQKNGYYYLSFADAQRRQWFLKAYYKLLDMGIELAGMDMLKHFRYSSHRPVTELDAVLEEGSLVKMNLAVVFGDEKIPLNLVQKTLLSGARAVMLKDGSLGVLNEEWLQEYGMLIKHSRVDKEQLTVSKFLAISEPAVFEKLNTNTRFNKEQWWAKWANWQKKDETVYQTPGLMTAELRPYQRKGFEWMLLLHEAGAGACLADDMGLGKTLQTICFIAHYVERNQPSRNIIVAPASLVYNWQQEFEKFCPSINVVVYHGANRKEKEQFNEATVIITSYGTLRSDAEVLTSETYGVAVIDESHNIRNPGTQITQAVTMINAAMRIALSGTPVVNNSFDLYSQLNFAVPGLFGSKEFFRKEYADAIDKYKDEEKIKNLQKLTAPFVLRRTKEQVAKDLPDRTESILWCNMSVEQQLVYENIRDQIRSSLLTGINKEGLNKSKLAVLQGMLKLRQVCNSPLLLPEHEQQQCRLSVKTEVLMEELENLGDHKAIVFSQFSTMLNLLADECNNRKIPFFLFDGSTPPAKRAEMVAAFQAEDCETKVFLISLKAGNTGLTLTAADYVFLFDPWWNKATEQQAIDRAHRIGQVRNVFAYKMICRNTIEEKIVQLQERKKLLAETLVAEDEGFVKQLTEEDVNFLFS